MRNDKVLRPDITDSIDIGKAGPSSSSIPAHYYGSHKDIAFREAHLYAVRLT
jgi:hypothetical protein